MALDGIVIHAIANQLQSCVGGRINKIYQPSSHDMILQIRARGYNLKLLLSAHPTYPRVHLTENSFMNPTEAPMFCMLLRKHCENGIIESVVQVGMERILHIDIKQRDELGDTQAKRLIIEIMGRHSNIILMDPQKNQILDGIQHVTPAISSHRVIMPGSQYVNPPDQHKHDPKTLSDKEIHNLFQNISEQNTEENVDLSKFIMNQFSGISPLSAKEVIYRSETQNQAPASLLIQVMSAIKANQYEPNIVQTKDGKAYFSVLKLTHLQGESQEFDTISTCLEAFYGDKAERDTVKQRTSDLIKFIQNEKKKNVKKLEKLIETIEKAKDADRYRILGELLTVSLHLVKRGDTQVEVLNYYDPDQSLMIIPLNPQLTPSDNAQHYFKRYNKSKNSLNIVQKQINSTKKETAYLDTIEQQLQDATLSDINEIREELIDQGYIRDRRKKQNKKKKKGQPQLHCFTSSEGIPIYVGKNNTQNEFLTNRLASANDTWLHTKDIPGSHVVIKTDSFTEITLEEAALLAAYYSQAKESSQVPVDYTLIRHVRKPSGAKPGYVIYDHQKTVFVTPDVKRIQQLPLSIK